MPSTLRGYALLGIRGILVAVGGTIAAFTIFHLVTLPPAPPDSDGFVTGAAYFWGSIIIIFALGMAGLGVVLPAILGTDDPLRFGWGQRVLLKTAAGMFGGGFLLGLAYGQLTEMQFGLFLWLGAILFGVLLIGVAISWRLVEAAATGLAHVVSTTF